MTTIEVTPRNFERTIRAKLRRDRREFIKAANEAVAIGLAHAVATTDRLGVVDRAIYKLAFRTRKLTDGAELRNDAPHAPIIEYGRRPGAAGPPLEPIRAWVVRKLVPAGAVEPDDVDSAAFAIRQAIHDRGLPPHGIFRLGRPVIFAAFRRLWKRRLTV